MKLKVFTDKNQDVFIVVPPKQAWRKYSTFRDNKRYWVCWKYTRFSGLDIYRNEGMGDFFDEIKKLGTSSIRLRNFEDIKSESLKQELKVFLSEWI
jgi:hypothetical protein